MCDVNCNARSFISTFLLTKALGDNNYYRIVKASHQIKAIIAVSFIAGFALGAQLSNRI